MGEEDYLVRRMDDRCWLGVSALCLSYFLLDYLGFSCLGLIRLDIFSNHNVARMKRAVDQVRFFH